MAKQKQNKKFKIAKDESLRKKKGGKSAAGQSEKQQGQSQWLDKKKGQFL